MEQQRRPNPELGKAVVLFIIMWLACVLFGGGAGSLIGLIVSAIGWGSEAIVHGAGLGALIGMAVATLGFVIFLLFGLARGRRRPLG